MADTERATKNPYVIECPVFYPTLEEIGGSWEAYISKIEKKFAPVGLAKIIPPKGWTPRRQGYKTSSLPDVPIERPIKQIATGKRGLYRTLLIEQKAMTLKNGFEQVAKDPENQPPKDADPETLERKFWQLITLKPPLYGADVPGTLFDKNLKGWNLRHLDSMLTRKLDQLKLELPGVSTPFLYFGMWRSIFAWHTEDMDLHSVNYLHYGAPKFWYCVPPPYRERFETLLKSLLPDMFRHCPEFVRHKELMVSPGLLAQNNIPVVKAQQHPGEFIINYPGAYHSGFNTGYNCAESCNFATKAWLPIGLDATPCLCDRDTVRIQMSIFADMVPAGKMRKALLESDPTSSEEENDSGSEASTSGSDSDASTDSDSSSSGRRRSGRRIVSGGRNMAAVAGGRGMAPISGAGGCAGRSHRHKEVSAARSGSRSRDEKRHRNLYSEVIDTGPSKEERAQMAAARSARAMQRSRARMGLRTSVRSGGPAGAPLGALEDSPRRIKVSEKAGSTKRKRASSLALDAVPKMFPGAVAAAREHARGSRADRLRKREAQRKKEEHDEEPDSPVAASTEHSSGSSHGTRVHLQLDAAAVVKRDSIGAEGPVEAPAGAQGPSAKAPGAVVSNAAVPARASQRRAGRNGGVGASLFGRGSSPNSVTKGQRSERRRRVDDCPDLLAGLLSQEQAGARQPSAPRLLQRQPVSRPAAAPAVAPAGGMGGVAAGLKSLASAITNKFMAGRAPAGPPPQPSRISKRLLENGAAERLTKRLREMQEAV